MTAAPHAHAGFLERWLRGCGQRLWRAFWLLWLILFTFSLSLLALRINHMPLSGQPPVPEGIPYDRYITGGIEIWDGSAGLELAELPVYDSQKHRSDVGFSLRTDPATGRKWLMAWAGNYVGWSGWPLFMLSWGSQSRWDVSDPSAPFPPAADPALEPLQFQCSGSHIGLWRARHDGARHDGFNLNLPGALAQLALPQLLAALIVCSATIIYRRRLRLRCRECRCLDCGHQLDKSHIDRPCPECGQTNPSISVARPAKRRFSPIVIVVLGLIPIWFGAQLTTMQVRRESVENQVRSRAELDMTFTGRVNEFWRQFGWPAPLVEIQRDQWFAFAAGEEPKRDLGPRPSQFAFDGVYLKIHYVHGDPSTTTLTNINWAWLLLHLGCLPFVIAMGAGAATLLRRPRRLPPR